MNTLTITTENNETYSSISNFFIDYYMTKANGEFVKVYLYLVRLLNNNSNITVASIADHFNLTEKDICRAIKYWITQNVLKLNYDGNGDVRDIVLLPLSKPVDDLFSKPSSDAISLLRMDKPSNVIPINKEIAQKYSDEDEDEGIRKGINSGKDKAKGEDMGDGVPAKPTFGMDYYNKKSEDSDFSDLIFLIDTYLGVKISSSDADRLLYVHDVLKFSNELYEYLIEYCAERGKKSIKYLEAVAIEWYKEGITTKKQAKDYIVEYAALTKIVFKALGIRSRNLTSAERDFLRCWSKTYGFSDELIKLACEKAILQRPSSANFVYVNGILDNWNKNNVKTISDVDKLDLAFASSNAKAKSNTVASINTVNTFKQTDLTSELDEMEKLLLDEVNSQ